MENDLSLSGVLNRHQDPLPPTLQHRFEDALHASRLGVSWACESGVRVARTQ